MATDSNIRVRRAQTLEDYEACVALQRAVWSFSHPHDYASVPLMRIQNLYGGCVLVGEDGHSRICGFSYALLCRPEGGNVFWWSHMTAVAPELQGTGAGFALKAAQRREALEAGIGEIRWTFDPLRARNAHFNIRKLGITASRYEPNLYGLSSSPLHNGLPTDRLEARWDIQSERVRERMEGTASVILRDFDGLVHVLEDHGGRPGPPNLGHRETPLLVEVPVEYPSARGASSEARDWQEGLRKAFELYFSEGYQVSDFILIQEPAPQALYVLERQDP